MLISEQCTSITQSQIVPTAYLTTKNRDDYERHYNSTHVGQTNGDSNGSETGAQKRASACMRCYSSKSACDKAVSASQLRGNHCKTHIPQTPACNRCQQKGLICEARASKKSTEAANQLARDQLYLERRYVTIAPSPGTPTVEAPQQYSYSETTASSRPATAPGYYGSGYDGFSRTELSATTNGYSSYEGSFYEAGNQNAFAVQNPQSMLQVSQGYPLTSEPSYNTSASSSVGLEQAQVSATMGWGSQYSTQGSYAQQAATTAPVSASAQMAMYPNVSYSSPLGYSAPSTYSQYY